MVIAMSNFRFPESWNLDDTSDQPPSSEQISYEINPTILGKPTLRPDKWWSYMLDSWVPSNPHESVQSTNFATASPGGQTSVPAGPALPPEAADNQRQNKMVRDIAAQLQLTKDQAQALHREISGQGMSYQEIQVRAKEMFGK